jgi:exodeoxyribonuclease-1
MRYRARNYPSTLNSAELEKWQAHRKNRFTVDNKNTCLSIAECQLEIAQLAERYIDDKRKLSLLSSLTRFIEQL